MMKSVSILPKSSSSCTADTICGRLERSDMFPIWEDGQVLHTAHVSFHSFTAENLAFCWQVSHFIVHISMRIFNEGR